MSCQCFAYECERWLQVVAFHVAFALNPDESEEHIINNIQITFLLKYIFNIINYISLFNTIITVNNNMHLLRPKIVFFKIPALDTLKALTLFYTRPQHSSFFEWLFCVIFRYVFIAGAYAYQVGLKYSDRFYTPLPLYHTAAGIMCIGQSLLYGCTTVIRKKFSASGYFQDISKHKCTVSHSHQSSRRIITRLSRPFLLLFLSLVLLLLCSFTFYKCLERTSSYPMLEERNSSP